MNATVRATNSIQYFNGKKDPSAQYAKQICGLMTGPNMFQQFERFINVTRGEKPLPEGDYEVVPKPAFIDRNGDLRVSFDLVPVAVKAKAA